MLARDFQGTVSSTVSCCFIRMAVYTLNNECFIFRSKPFHPILKTIHETADIKLSNNFPHLAD